MSTTSNEMDFYGRQNKTEIKRNKIVKRAEKNNHIKPVICE